MVAEHDTSPLSDVSSCSLAKISMVAELNTMCTSTLYRCSLAKISMVAELLLALHT